MNKIIILPLLLILTACQNALAPEPTVGDAVRESTTMENLSGLDRLALHAEVRMHNITSMFYEHPIEKPTPSGTKYDHEEIKDTDSFLMRSGKHARNAMRDLELWGKKKYYSFRHGQDFTHADMLKKLRNDAKAQELAKAAASGREADLDSIETEFQTAMAQLHEHDKKQISDGDKYRTDLKKQKVDPKEPTKADESTIASKKSLVNEFATGHGLAKPYKQGMVDQAKGMVGSWWSRARGK